MDIPCQFCDQPTQRRDMQEHLRNCAAAKRFQQARQATMRTKITNPGRRHFSSKPTSLWSESNEDEIENSSRTNSLSDNGRSVLRNRGERELPLVRDNRSIKQQNIWEEQDGRVACVVCGRKFTPDRLSKHQGICRRVSRKKRRPFNSQKQRIQGSELAGRLQLQNMSNTKTLSSVQGTWHTNWKAKHREFQNMIRSARMASNSPSMGQNWGSTASLGGRDSSPSSELHRSHRWGGSRLHSPIGRAQSPSSANLVPCRYCHRSFAPQTAERHIPKCAGSFNRPNPPKKYSNSLSQKSPSPNSFPQKLNKSFQTDKRTSFHEEMKKATFNSNSKTYIGQAKMGHGLQSKMQLSQNYSYRQTR